MEVDSTIDIQVPRPMSYLFKVLLGLIQELDFKDINIKVLAKKAGISRQTFYSNYKTIEDIMIEELDRRAGDFYKLLDTELMAGNYFNASKKAFILLEMNLDLFVALQKADLENTVLDRLDKYLLRIIKITAGTKELSAKSIFAAHFFAGGVYMVFSKWVENNMKTPTAELADLFKVCFKLASSQQ